MSSKFGFKILKNTSVIRKVYILNGQPSYMERMQFRIGQFQDGQSHSVAIRFLELESNQKKR